jgi:hypothetical protein
MGLWWYEISSKSPIALWETERGMISAVDFSQNGVVVLMVLSCFGMGHLTYSKKSPDTINLAKFVCSMYNL